MKYLEGVKLPCANISIKASQQLLLLTCHELALMYVLSRDTLSVIGVSGKKTNNYDPNRKISIAIVESGDFDNTTFTQ